MTEHRRIQILGSEEEKKQVKSAYKNECDFQMNLRNMRAKEEQRRDVLETRRCEDLFMQKCQQA